MTRRGGLVARVALILFVVGWTAALVVPPLVLLRSRAAWLETLERPEAQEQWDEFRDAMKRQSGREGPVQRKVPKSAEPPLRVWLRDYIWLAIAAWLVLGGTLGVFTGTLVLGGSFAEDQPRRGGDAKEQNERDAKNAEK